MGWIQDGRIAQDHRACLCGRVRKKPISSDGVLCTFISQENLSFYSDTESQAGSHKPKHVHILEKSFYKVQKLGFHGSLKPYSQRAQTAVFLQVPPYYTKITDNLNH